ncbi:hypothetical protein H206_05404 [Candidatus Electrothrix aarhusensis]|uniref:Uncharacterized protein n=1 Tax=Candidatus Electrothrix aarhusensis TaxID=1859131 RepID=A0A444J4K1_9BACT|nr:hypothetical protein H206_05404 [Candidatus Electrothrix aarhusensis]
MPERIRMLSWYRQLKQCWRRRGSRWGLITPYSTAPGRSRRTVVQLLVQEVWRWAAMCKAMSSLTTAAATRISLRALSR